MTAPPVEACRLCGGNLLSIIYEGPIRIGPFNSLSSQSHRVLKCESCGVKMLPPVIANPAEYYETAQYRDEVDAGAAVANFYKVHDAEQARNVGLTGTEQFRGKVVMDVGCGAGSFLDLIQGFAEKIVAIEPSIEFQDELRKKGFQTFAYPADAHRELAGQVDLAVCFSVIEHVNDPVDFLRSIRALLAPGGSLFLSTPNAGDLLINALPEIYASFFYRKVHPWYFDKDSLQRTFALAGFESSSVAGHHRFGLGNFLHWIRYNRPGGQVSMDFITPAIEAVWRTELERTLTCDYLFATASV